MSPSVTWLVMSVKQSVRAKPSSHLIFSYTLLLNARIATNSLAKEPSLHTFENAKTSLGKCTNVTNVTIQLTGQNVCVSTRSEFMRRVAIPVTSAGRCLTPRITSSDTRRYTLGVISHVLTVTRHSSI